MYDTDYLAHHGIKGQKWGVRRYQNYDGSRTSEGEKKYSDKQRIRDEKIYGKKAAKRIQKRIESGEGVQSARHDEAVRRSSAPGRRRIGIGVAKGAIGAGLVTASVLAATGKTTAGKTLNGLANNSIGALGRSAGLNMTQSMALTKTAMLGVGAIGVKELYSGGKDILYGTRDIERNRTKFK